MRNHFLRAAAGPKPIKFADAVANSGTFFVTSELSVSTDDFVFIFSAGTQADSNRLTANSTATISRANTTNTSNSGTYFIEGDGGNDFLIDSRTGSSFGHGFWSVASSGVLRFEDISERDAAGFMVAISEIDASNYDVDVDTALVDIDAGTAESNTATLSLTGIGPNDFLLYAETVQPEQGNSPSYPTLPSGFTNAGIDQTWTVGTGGNAVDWRTRVGYLENPGSTFSHTVNATDGWNGAIIIRFYNL